MKNSSRKRLREKLKKKLNLLIMSMIMLLPLALYANAPEYIRVGLEAVYKDVPEIKLSGENGIQLGYTSQQNFYTLGTLESTTVRIKESSGDYYYYDGFYESFQMAEKAAKAYEDAVVTYRAPDDFRLYTTNPNAGEKVLGSKDSLEIYNEKGKLIAISHADTIPLAFQGESNTYDFPVTKVGDNRSYRGAIEIVKGEKTGLTAVNVIEMEAYLYSVVPCEMVPSWPLEALKAQAVAARSMATFQYNRHIKKGYNVVDTTTTQVYGGLTKEDKRTTEAVNETRGEIAWYKDKVAETLYYSTSGGYTEDPKYVWGNTIDYLKALPDPYETEPEQAPWTRTITMKEIDKCLANVGANIGSAQGLSVISRTSSGRVQELQIIGTTGVHTLTNESTRTFFSSTNEGSLKSRMFNFSSSDYTNTGTGNTKTEGMNKINIMTEDDLVSQFLDKLYAISAEDLVPLSNKIWVQSDSEVVELKATSNQTENNVVGTNETVYGDFTVYGKGFGHGVGMSQSGAKGMAEEGFDYQEIMKYYFLGIEIQR